MKRYEYMKITLSIIPKEIITQYNLCALVTDGWVYMDIWKGMPGQKIANDRFKIHLAKFGYAAVAHTPSLWKNACKKITLALVVDNFGVKYVGNQHVKHLIQVLQKLLTLSIYWTCTLFFGLTIAWYYENRTCYISTAQYLKEALGKFQYPVPQRPQDAPHLWNFPT